MRRRASCPASTWPQRHAAPVRRTLGGPTAINYLAPLTNPARPGAAVVDEITTAAPTDVWITDAAGHVHASVLDTARHGLAARSCPDSGPRNWKAARPETTSLAGSRRRLPRWEFVAARGPRRTVETFAQGRGLRAAAAHRHFRSGRTETTLPTDKSNGRRH